MTSLRRRTKTLAGLRTVRVLRGRYATGALVLHAYEHSLSALFFILFFGAVVGHAIGGAKDYSDQELAMAAAVTALQYLGTSQFWFESFQNWQSEFLAVAVIVWASVYLRQRGSPESKPVADSHHDTGA